MNKMKTFSTTADTGTIMLNPMDGAEVLLANVLKSTAKKVKSLWMSYIDACVKYDIWRNTGNAWKVANN